MRTAKVETVLGAEKKTLKKQKGWRIDSQLADYVEERGKVSGETNVIEDCIRLHRTLSEVLAGQAARLSAYAEKHAMTMRDHESAVLAQLVLAGLDAYEKSRRK